MFTSQLYLLNDRMVFYSKVDDRIEKEIEYKDITYINETKSIIEFKAGRKKFYLKYKDNTVLLISLKRIFKNYKIDISEHTNPPRVEETVETILFGKK
ncbi:MAG: hypothetical protein DRP42_00425 [Tenericutes bacterium]|nr:MAG: hypothetical protein DRP42_00425 [Mycoplasmatota bacterium]